MLGVFFCVVCRVGFSRKDAKRRVDFSRKGEMRRVDFSRKDAKAQSVELTLRRLACFLGQQVDFLVANCLEKSCKMPRMRLKLSSSMQ